jgi:hypothetical protein
MSKPLPDVYFHLAEIRERIATPDRWCQFMYGSDEFGQVCLATAVRNEPIHYHRRLIIEDLLLAAAKQLYHWQYSSLESFNDQTWTEHADVLAVIDRAMQLCLENNDG